MKHFLSLFVCASMLAVSSFSAYAQRQTAGRPSVDVRVSFSTLDAGRFSFSGFGASWSSYQYRSHVSWGFDVSALPVSVDIVTPAAYDTEGVLVYPQSEDHYEHVAYDITAGGGYYFRLLSPRSRTVILSAGVSGFAGVRYCGALAGYSTSDFDTSVESGSSNDKALARTGFVLNIVPEVILEAFPFSNASFFVSCRPRMNVVNTGKGTADWLKVYLGVGAKYYL